MYVYNHDYAGIEKAFLEQERAFELAMARYYRAKAALFEIEDSPDDTPYNAACDELFEARQAIYGFEVNCTRSVSRKIDVFKEEERDNDVNDTVYVFLASIQRDVERVQDRLNNEYHLEKSGRPRHVAA